MTDETDWLLRPVIEHMCQYEFLINGTLDLCDIALMNEALDVSAENQQRIQEAIDRQRNS